MHKKIKAELVSLANSILQMNNNDDIDALHKKAQDIYEKLSVLKFVNSNIGVLREEVEEETETIIEDEFVSEETPQPKLEEETKIIEEEIDKGVISEEQLEDFFDKENSMVKDDATEIPSVQISLEEEFKDAISADVATQLFEKPTKENPVIENKPEIKRSLNDALKSNVMVGLNDRIAFVKHLFNGSQEDFNRVLSQLNSFKTEDEAKAFVTDFVKPDYDWSNKEEYEERLLNLIERKFL